MASRTLGLYSQASNTLATAFHNAYFASGGGGGSQTLAQTLVNGNTTGGTDIIQTSGDSFKSSSNSDLKLELDGNGKVLIEQNGFSGNAFPMLKLVSVDNNNVGATIDIYQDNSAVAPNDEIVSINFKGNSSTTNEETYANIGCLIEDPTFSSMNAYIRFLLRHNGTLTVPLYVYGNYIKPIALMDNLSTTGETGQILSCSATGTGALRWISPFTNMTATGGVVNTYYEGYTRYTSHTFLTTGSFTITSYGTNVVPEIDMLIVGGGGGGGASNGTGAFAGGGGAGCVIQISGFPLNSTATLPDLFTVSVGNGGNGATPANTGSTGGTTTVSIPANLMLTGVALGITATGGGGGAGGINAPANGVASSYVFTTHAGSTLTTITPTSSSGGGQQGAGSSTTAPTAVFNSAVGDLYSSETVRSGGYRGGIGTTSATRAGCSGGGSSSQGIAPTTLAQYIVGGSLGHTTYWDGTKRMVGGGGLGATSGTVVANPTSALYGGGIGEATGSAFSATAGTANTGGGGGASSSLGIAGANGGSGIVIIRYKS
jgi:hypothetical protein